MSAKEAADASPGPGERDMSVEELREHASELFQRVQQLKEHL
jgi:hypothetical protein